MHENVRHSGTRTVLDLTPLYLKMIKDGICKEKIVPSKKETEIKEAIPPSNFNIDEIPKIINFDLHHLGKLT